MKRIANFSYSKKINIIRTGEAIEKGQIFDANNVKKNHSKQTFDMYHEYLFFIEYEEWVGANLFYNEATIPLE